MTISYIKPECSPFYYNEKGEKIYQKNKNRKGIAYCSDGFLLPCCWCDTIGNGDFRARGFKDDKMKLENNEDQAKERIRIAEEKIAIQKRKKK